MAKVFLAQHIHKMHDGSCDTKLIGVYATESDANAAVRRVSDRAGFRDFPEGFTIEAYVLDQDQWEDELPASK
jgi:hypothetical protein